MQKKWWTLLAVCLGTFMLLLDITIVNVALPDIQHSLRSSFSDLQWVVDAYALTLAALLLTAGSLADLFGRRKLFAIGLVIFTAGSLLCGLAQSSEMLILSRGGQGVGGAIMFATSLALLAQAFQGPERGLAFGIWGSITGVAVAIGPVLGGVLTSGLSWKWIFFVNVPIGAFAFFVTVSKLDESRQPSARRPDWVGFVLFTASLSALVYGLIRSNEKGWTEQVVLACFAAAAVLMVAFVVAEKVGQHAMFDLRLFRKPTFVGSAVAAFSLSASAFALLLYLVLYLQDAKGYSALGTGLRLLVYSGAIMVAATVAGRLSARVPVKWLISPGLLLVGVGLLLETALATSSNWTVLIPGFIVSGIGTGMVNPPLASSAIGVVQPPQAGMASGINSTFRQVGIATGTAALGSIFGSKVTSTLRGELANVPGLAGHTSSLSSAIRNGAGSQAIAATPPQQRAVVAHAALSSFVRGLDELLLIAAVVALAGGVLCLFLIRAKDFVTAGAPGGAGATDHAGAVEGSQAPAHRDMANEDAGRPGVLISAGPPARLTAGADGAPATNGADGASATNGADGAGATNGHVPAVAGDGGDRSPAGGTLDGPAWGGPSRPATRELPPPEARPDGATTAPEPAAPPEAVDPPADDRITREVTVSLSVRLRGPGFRGVGWWGSRTRS